MPFWPLFMGAAAFLTWWGIRAGAWQTPAIVLFSYISVRMVVTYIPTELHEVTICAIWLIAAMAMGMLKSYLPSFFYALSGLTYPVFLIFGFRIEYLGLSPIIAEIFAFLALLSIGGGLYGLSVDRHPSTHRARFVHRLSSAALGVAPR